MFLPFTTATLVCGFLMGVLSAYLAHRRGKNLYLWFSLGFLFGIFGILAIFFAPNPKKKESSSVAPVIQEPAPAPSIQGPKDKFWYYLDPTHVQQGPVSFDALTTAWREGKITVSTYVWNEDLTDWKVLAELVK